MTGLNLNVMNATQLAVYFTGRFPSAIPSQINAAVQSLLSERSKTEFGLNNAQLNEFMRVHFDQHSGTKL